MSWRIFLIRFARGLRLPCVSECNYLIGVPWYQTQGNAEFRHVWSRRLVAIASVCGCLAFITLVWEIGWPVSEFALSRIRAVTWGLVILAALVELGLNLLEPKREHLRRGMILLALPLFAALQMIFGESIWPVLNFLFPAHVVPYVAMGVVQVNLILPTVVRIIRVMRDQRWFNRLPPGLIGVLSFALLILLGAGLLMTPNASKEGMGVVDAVFMSTSAVCVTGLSTLNVETQLTLTGQAILLALIQIGGLGVMTLTYFLALVAGQGISLRDRVALRDLLSEDNMGRVGNFVWHIVGSTLLIELIGILMLHHFWAATHQSPGSLWWDSVFHGISAFCNAGFSTYGDGLMHASVVNNHAVHSVIMALIILGGFGFGLITEISRYSFAWLKRWRTGQRAMMPRLSVHCRLAATTTILLLVFGALAYLWSGLSPWESLFNSVTCRTAGFNISSFGGHGTAALVVSCVLMAIGGNPGGTAGGIKTTTFAIIVLEMRRILTGQRDLQLWDRRASRDAVERSLATLALCLIWIGVASYLVGTFNPLAATEDVVFECISAFGTVGLSRGFTGSLSDGSKWVITLTMFAGRIGILTFALSLIGPKKTSKVRLPESRIPLG
jgi:Trk-type K+ transport system membrane component